MNRKEPIVTTGFPTAPYVEGLRAMSARRTPGTYPAVIVTNLFAFRATDPRQIKAVADPVGPENDRWIHSDFTAGVHDDRGLWRAWG
jgi:hypothetical protein